MTEHVTIALEPEQPEQVRGQARSLGVSVEAYLSRLVGGSLPVSATRPAGKPPVSAIFGIGASAEDTDVGCDKDLMLGEAVWAEHQRKTQKAS